MARVKVTFQPIPVEVIVAEQLLMLGEDIRAAQCLLALKTASMRLRRKPKK